MTMYPTLDLVLVSDQVAVPNLVAACGNLTVMKKTNQKRKRNKKLKASDMESDIDGKDNTNKVDDTGQVLYLWPKPVPKDVIVMTIVDTKKVYKSKVSMDPYNIRVF